MSGSRVTTLRSGCVTNSAAEAAIPRAIISNILLERIESTKHSDVKKRDRTHHGLQIDQHEDPSSSNGILLVAQRPWWKWLKEQKLAKLARVCR